MAPAGRDERLPVQFRHLDPLPPGQPVTAGHREQYLLRQQHHRAQGRTGHRLGSETYIRLAGAQLAGHRLGGRLPQPDIDTGMSRAEPGEQPGQGQERLARHGDTAAAPVTTARRVRQFAAPVLKLRQRPVHAAQEGRAMPVEVDPATPAVEERHTQLRLQPGDRPAHRRLGDAQFVGRPADVLVARDDLEAAQRQQIHQPPLSYPLHISQGIVS